MRYRDGNLGNSTSEKELQQGEFRSHKSNLEGRIALPEGRVALPGPNNNL